MKLSQKDKEKLLAYMKRDDVYIGKRLNKLVKELIPKQSPEKIDDTSLDFIKTVMRIIESNNGNFTFSNRDAVVEAINTI